LGGTTAAGAVAAAGVFPAGAVVAGGLHEASSQLPSRSISNAKAVLFLILSPPYGWQKKECPHPEAPTRRRP
jgi:hypothetical protein